MKYYVYKITNTINDMFYIGKTYDLKTRFKQHIDKSKDLTSMTYLSQALRQFGEKSFQIEELHECETEEDALIMEAREVLERGAARRNVGYNHPQPKHGKAYKTMAAMSLSTEEADYRSESIMNGKEVQSDNEGFFMNGMDELIKVSISKEFPGVFNTFAIDGLRVYSVEIYPMFSKPDVVKYQYLGNMISFDWMDKFTPSDPMYQEYMKAWSKMIKNSGVEDLEIWLIDKKKDFESLAENKTKFTVMNGKLVTL